MKKKTVVHGLPQIQEKQGACEAMLHRKIEKY